MHEDAQGLVLTTIAPEAATGYDSVIGGYLKYRVDTPLRLKAALKADPEAPMLQVLKGSFAMLAYKQSYVDGAKQVIEAMQPRAARRDRARARACRRAGAPGPMARWTARWRSGRGSWTRIRATSWPSACTISAPSGSAGRRRCWRRWRASCRAGIAAVPGWGSVLACRASPTRNAATTPWPRPPAAPPSSSTPATSGPTHAVAHVLEMQGRRGEGIAWIKGLEPHWDGGNNLTHHLLVAPAMYHLERREFDAVLELYDCGFRDLDSAVTQQQPDLYIDVQNAASMLFRLQRHGVDVGDRWIELADKAEARIGDCLSRLHPAALDDGAVRDGTLRRGAVACWRACATSPAATAAPRRRSWRDTRCRSARPCCCTREGNHAGAVAVMRPALQGMYALGGSHAQQDVLEQLFLDAAMKAGLHEDARMLLERVAGRHPVPPERRLGYAAAARAVPH